MPPSPVQISHKKDGHQRWPHRFHVSSPPYLAAGSDAENIVEDVYPKGGVCNGLEIISKMRL